jgi:hypothetical protein
MVLVLLLSTTIPAITGGSIPSAGAVAAGAVRVAGIAVIGAFVRVGLGRGVFVEVAVGGKGVSVEV